MADQAELRTQLMDLWRAMGVNPRNRALVVARSVATHGDAATRDLFVELIERQTPPSWERNEALSLLVPKNFFSHIQIIPDPPVTTLRVDAELGRLSIALSLAALFRLWIIGREITRSATGSGVISKQALKARVAALGVSYTARHYNRLLAAGNGLFWALSGSEVYLKSSAKVACLLVTKAKAENIPVEGNLPGVRDVLVDVSGTLERWEGMLYAGWICYKSYHRDITIARETLSKLFNRHENTIRRWEAERLEGVLTKRKNFAQCPDIERYFEYIPEHAQAYVARLFYKGQFDDVIRLRWQLPNTYHALMERHSHTGQASKVRGKVNAEHPAEEQRGGHCLRYLASPEKLKRLYRSFKHRVGQLGDPRRPIYVYLGDHTRSKQGMFEITNSGYVFTHANERASRSAENEVFFLKRQERERFLYGEVQTK